MPSLITVSYSELDTYRQCPLKHQLAYKERWTKPPREGGPLDKGTLWHAVLEQHYKAIQLAQDKRGDLTVSDDELTAAIVGRVKPLLYHDRSGEFISETAELIWWMYTGYVKHYGFDPNWKILAVEHHAVVPIYTPMNAETGEAGKKTRYRLKVKIDLVIRDRSLGDKMWVVDHKSGKDLPAGRALELDDQFGLYTLGMRRIGKPVFGQVYNASRTQRNKTGVQTLESRNARPMLYRDDPELLAIEEDAWKTCVSAYGPKPAALRGRDPGAAPNTDTCRWKCDFMEPHLAARKASGDQSAALRELVRDFGFVQNFERH